LFILFADSRFGQQMATPPSNHLPTDGHSLWRSGPTQGGKYGWSCKTGKCAAAQGCLRPDVGDQFVMMGVLQASHMLSVT
jgi:hypothetical protein